MIGDKLVITEYHRQNGIKVATRALEEIKKHSRIYTITVAGESGSGKSETAATSAQELEGAGYKCVVLGQDDYFRLPPKSNEQKRTKGIEWVGTGEVRLDLMDEHLRQAKNGASSITKPLVYFEEDRIDEELLSLDGVQVVIAEGTYTTMLEEADLHVFIDRSYLGTVEHRKQRARDQAEGSFIEQILEIEHKIISAAKPKAHIVLPPPQE